MEKHTFVNRPFVSRHAKDTSHINSEFVDKKTREFLDKGGIVEHLNYTGEPNFDLGDLKHVNGTEDGDEDILRNGGRTAWDQV